MTPRSVTVLGAGVLGLWQALTLAKAGHRVRLIERRSEGDRRSASALAGVLLGPDCESEGAPSIVRSLGYEGIARWREVYPGLTQAGTLVVASGRHKTELDRFARHTQGHRRLTGAAIGELEPSLDRFADGLFYPKEAHMAPVEALDFLLSETERLGVHVLLGHEGRDDGDADVVVDCRGMAARAELPDLRGVRGERVLVRARDVRLSRPVRFLHPRHPIYVVPWQDRRFMIGATVIESEDEGPVTVRSALELLSSAYDLHPAFGEAEILDLGAGVRPAFPDNVPRALVNADGRRIYVNGAYRHGYLLAPALAEAVRAYLETGAMEHALIAPLRAASPAAGAPAPATTPARA